jgi:hypothetical protein
VEEDAKWFWEARPDDVVWLSALVVEHQACLPPPPPLLPHAQARGRGRWSHHHRNNRCHLSTLLGCLAAIGVDSWLHAYSTAR